MWLFENKIFKPVDLDPKSTYGFIYEITNLVNQKSTLVKNSFGQQKLDLRLKEE